MTILWTFLLLLALAIGWLLTLLGLPGNWLIVVATTIFAWFVPERSQLTITLTGIPALIALAILAEVLQLGAVFVGAGKIGPSGRSAALALLAAALGSVFGFMLAKSARLTDPIVLSVLLAGGGGAVGAVVGEIWGSRQINEDWQVGQSAFWAKLLATLAKIFVGSIMVVVAVMALLW
jgi:uncharacterized protein